MHNKRLWVQVLSRMLGREKTMRDIAMRRIALGLGAAAAALCSPAMARDGEGYVGADVGVVFPDDFDTDVGGTLDANTTENQTGWELAGILGYDWGIIRTELEGSYKEWDPEAITLVGNRAIPQFNGTQVSNGTYPLSLIHI